MQQDEEFTASQLKLMQLLTMRNKDLSEQVEALLCEALAASDLEHHVEAESLFQEALKLLRTEGREDDYSFLPVLLHYCSYLFDNGRYFEYDILLAEFKRRAIEYEW